MGAAATRYLITHYPDLFAAAAPFCGYCDYQLWEKPGGLYFPYAPLGGAAVRIIEDLQHTPIWIVRGEWDRVVGGDVLSFILDRWQEIGLPWLPLLLHRSSWSRTRLSNRRNMVTDHNLVASTEKERHPKQVALAIYSLRHSQSRWIRIDQLEI